MVFALSDGVQIKETISCLFVRFFEGIVSVFRFGLVF